MKTPTYALALLLSTLTAACGSTPNISTRSAPAAVAPVEARQIPLTVSRIEVEVPRSLSVSEANSYYPIADIVWRGDPIGDRHAQVADILETGFTAGTAPLAGTIPVILQVQAVRFHSISEKARYSVGGVHNIIFDLTVLRAEDGLPLAPTRRVEANLPALGGTAAIEADRRGETQKVRIHGFLQQVIRQELSRFVTG